MSQISLLSNSSCFTDLLPVNGKEDVATGNTATINHNVHEHVSHVVYEVENELCSSFQDNHNTNAWTSSEEADKLFGAFKALSPGSIQRINGYDVTPIINVDSSANGTDNVCMMVDLHQMVLFKWSQIDVWLRKSKFLNLITQFDYSLLVG